MPTLLGQARQAGASLRSTAGIPVFDESYTFLVLADSKTQGRDEILTTSGLPVLNVSTSAGGFAVCRSLSGQRRPDNALYWDVTAEFSTEVEEGQTLTAPGTPAQDPLTWVPIYETKWERIHEQVTKDQSGTTIANSAGQPFHTGIIRPRTIPVWEFFQFEAATITDEQMADRNETVNANPFKGRAAKTLLLIVLSSVIGRYYGQLRRFTHYQLKYNSANWRHKRQDTGTVYLDTGQQKAYLDADNNVILGSLNGSGGKQTPGTAPAILEFDLYPTDSFSFLRV